MGAYYDYFATMHQARRGSYPQRLALVRCRLARKARDEWAVEVISGPDLGDDIPRCVDLCLCGGNSDVEHTAQGWALDE